MPSANAAHVVPVESNEEEPARIENAAFDLTPEATPRQSPAKERGSCAVVFADNPLYR